MKKDRNAIILAHNYQLGEIQDIADYVGDSLELARKAAQTQASVIVFCGVHFMAETAAITCPNKLVLLPEEHAGCPMADMITADDVKQLQKTYPGAPAVCYVNTSAAVKAECHTCCTSANAVRVVNSLPQDEIIFAPDKFLGAFVQRQTEKKLHLWPGFCPTHARILPQHILRRKEEHPAALVVAHPECRPEVQALADAVLSTGGMVSYARRTEVTELIVGTEIGIIHRLQKENPLKRFYPVSEQAVCPNMKRTTEEKILWALEELKTEVKVPEAIRARAHKAIERMLAIA